MADFKTSDYKTYEQSMWQEPKASNQSLWHEPAERYGSIPEPLYRLRLSVLKDDQGANDCPARTFVYPTRECLETANSEIKDVIGGAFSNLKIQKGGIEGRGATTTDENVMAATDDGRTESVVLRFETQNADESWTEFVKRLDTLEERWTVDSGEESGKAY